MEILSIIGAIASIISSIIAYKQSILSKKYATEAERVRNEIIDRRKLVEVSQLYSETKRILSVVSEIGATFTEYSLKGINHVKIAEEVVKYLRFLNEQSVHFDENDKKNIKKLINSLNSDIEKLSEALDWKGIKKYGKDIYYKINEFLPLVKSLNDEKKEKKAPFQ